MDHMLFSLPASFETYQGLGNFMFTQGLKQEMHEIVDEAIAAWMAAFLDAKSNRSPATLDGYQWKDVFLPDGAILRNVYKRTSYLAYVRGRELLFEGKAVSPAQFVNQISGSFRNAWETIWIRLPNEVEWKRAVTLRTKSRRNKRKQE
ncbi:hypothetical protein [Duganella sp. Root1480D1]|uniref:hypothetical protein n=1 Tax=Duganella sp. Root1480D1 TaxID=1736471 RepID=UPI0007089E75|nr:hypothetical protein [Duganella sp. Root1480D1]KQZ28117.1 hypothetical protein ASD58_11790 [Duganella sp. Root1480D1]